jgi:hypothetical protein
VNRGKLSINSRDLLTRFVIESEYQTGWPRGVQPLPVISRTITPRRAFGVQGKVTGVGYEGVLSTLASPS